MQYILSEEEMAKFRGFEQDARTLSDILARKPSNAMLQKICTKAANEWPVVYWNNKEAKPWGCLITVTKHGDQEWYCDNCPVQKICPYPHKEYSK